MKKFLTGSLLLISCGLAASCSKFTDTGWWTGPLFASHARAVSPNHYYFEPYLFYIATQGKYNNSWNHIQAPHFYTVSPQFYMAMGLIENLEFAANFTWQNNTYLHHDSSGFSDTYLQLGYQVMKDDHGGPNYDLLLYVAEFLPTGKFENLQPEFEGADSTGFGAYITAIGLNAQKTYQLDDCRLMRLRYNLQYLLPSWTSVRGANAYGGGTGTSGHIYVGPTFSVIFATEVQLTQNWVFACDYQYEHGWAASFKGAPGINTKGEIATNGYPSWDFFGISPAIEYNFNKDYGIIAGVWISIAGRNTAAFISPLIAFNAFF